MQVVWQELCFSCGLVPATAPSFKGVKLLIAADCTAYAYAAFHRDFMRGKVTIVGCPNAGRHFQWMVDSRYRIR